MKLLVDDADIAKIRRIYEYYPVDGVTTNPSILAKSGRKPYEVLREIRAFIGDEAQLHAQAISRDAEGMVKEAYAMADALGRNTYIKIPAVPEGFKAMQILRKKGFNITATAIYTPMQAFIAAKSGANYAAPYINRIDNLGTNGVECARIIHDIFKNYKFDTEVLAASFKNSLQVQELCAYGVGAITAACSVIEGLVKNPTVDSADEDFVNDFERLCGEGKTMLDC